MLYKDSKKLKQASHFKYKFTHIRDAELLLRNNLLSLFPIHPTKDESGRKDAEHSNL